MATKDRTARAKIRAARKEARKAEAELLATVTPPPDPDTVLLWFARTLGTLNRIVDEARDKAAELKACGSRLLDAEQLKSFAGALVDTAGMLVDAASRDISREYE